MNVKWVCKECNSTNTCEKTNQMKCFVCGTIRTNEVLFDCEPSKPTAYSPSESEDTPDALYERAEKCFKVGSLKKAFDLYRRAAELGHANAQNKLSSMYEFGQGTERDLAQALFWCQKAANQGHAAAKTRISKLEGTAKPRFALFLPEHSTAERWLLVLGWVCLANLIPMLYLIGIINSGSGISEFILPAFIFCLATILPIAYRQFYLWHQIIAWESPNAFLNIIWLVVEALGEFFGVFWLCIFALLLYGIFAAAPELTDVSELTFDVLFLMWYVFSLGFYFLSWSIWRRRRKKKA